MIYLFKALLQKGISLFPYSGQINYFFQHFVTRNLPLNDSDFIDKVMVANQHINYFIKYSGKKPEHSRYFEFGAGWDLIIPLAFHFAGVNDQTIINIRFNLRYELINNSLCRFKILQNSIKLNLYERLKEYEHKDIISVKELENQFGIKYQTQVNALKTSFQDNTFDFISNTATLEHIPETELKGIFKECLRILKPGGILSCLIDLKDHYFYFDKSISCYNFLKYSEPIWNLFNSSIFYQNRLRYNDYIKIAANSGFSVVEQKIDYPTETEINILENLKISKNIRENYSLKDIGIKELWLVLRKSE